MVTGFPVHPQCDREGPTQCVSWVELEVARAIVEDYDHRGYHMHAFLLKVRSKIDSAREDHTCTFFVSTYLSSEGFSMNIYGYVKPTSLLGCALYKEE